VEREEIETFMEADPICLDAAAMVPLAVGIGLSRFENLAHLADT